VLGLADAAHAEYGPVDAAPLVIVPVACAVPDRAPGAPSLSGRLKIQLAPGSRVSRIIGQDAVEEEFFCSYELNPDFQQQLDATGLRVSGVAETGEARVVEISAHPFFLATAFLPQLASAPGKPHPLLVAFLQAAAQSQAAFSSPTAQILKTSPLPAREGAGG
jgi:CTP synthase (UTP-ammonia lyase)